MRVGIVGFGWVGKSMKNLFDRAIVYDPLIAGRVIEEDEYHNALERVTDDKEEINACDIVFVCVPTPAIGEGKLDTSIVEDCVSWIQAKLIVIRSTVNPGDTVRYAEKYQKNVVVQPEYLGETPNHPMIDASTRPFLVIGGSPENTKKLIDLYWFVYNANIEIHQLTAYEAEVVKLSENRAIAFKVAQCQELYDVCEKTGVNYYKIRDVIFGADPRFNLWFTAVYPESRGLKSKCIPKDVYAWSAWAESVGYKPVLTRTLLEKNKEWVGEEGYCAEDSQ